MNAITCPMCGVSNPENAKFCGNCGRALKSACPDCGADVPDGAKFCGNCGIRLTGGGSAAGRTEHAVLTEETRKVVTILFADIVGSTGLVERLDPEEAREVMKKFYSIVQGVVENWFGGSVANYAGDAVLAFFGLPAAHEDDPERAVRAGLAIQQAIPVLNTHLASAHGVQLAARVGINTGEVVAASGSSLERDFFVSDAVTTAARLQQTVAPGIVVVGERTHRLTRDAIEYRKLPPLSVKGKSGPLNAWEAVGALPERLDIRRVTAPLIGRHGELGILRHLYQRSHDDGRVHLVTILGQPGVGKSRLMREFLAEVREKDPAPLVLRGRSVSFGGQIGYHALLDILRFQGGLLDSDPPETVRTKLQTWLGSVLPDQPQLLEGLLLTFGTEGQDGSGEDAGRVRRMLFDGWRMLVMALASNSRPVILAFEDLHWADDGVLDLIEMLADRGERLPVFIVCLARPELLERRPSWSGGRRNATNLDLEPLRQGETEQLVAALGSKGLTPDAVALIAQRAGGNPLFVEELVRMMMEGTAPGSQIPDTVQAVLTARIDRLPLDERRVLQAASVVGRTFWPSAVSPIAGMSSEETASALRILVTKELIVPRPTSTLADEQEYAFRHILTRDVAYGMIPKAQRQRAHAQTGRWLETRLGDRVEEVIEILAEHMRMADDDRAVEYLHRAANKARRLYANADAVRLFTQALDAAGAGRSALQAAVYRDRGDVHQLVGEYARALEDFKLGLRAAQEAGERALQAALQNRIGLIYHRQMHLAEAERAFLDAARLAREADDRVALGGTLIDLANIDWDRGRMPPDHPALVEGLSLLREAGDRASLARGLNLLCMSFVGAGDGPEAIAAAEEGLAASRTAEDRSREATSLSYLCVIHGFLGRYRMALPYGFQALKIAESIGDRRRASYTRFFIGRIQTAFGQWAEAIVNLEQGREMIHGLARIHYPWLFYFSGLAYELVGDIAAARTMWRSGADVESSSPAWRQMSLLSAIELARSVGDAGGLTRALDELVGLPGGIFIPSDVEAVLLAGEALLDAGRFEDLTTFLAARREGIERFGSGHGLASLPMLDARLAAREGKEPRVRAMLESALDLARGSEDVPREWRALELRAELLGGPADRSALREFLERTANTLPPETRGMFQASARVAGGTK